MANLISNGSFVCLFIVIFGLLMKPGYGVVIGPFPGFFGNQVCVRNEGLSAPDGKSAFLRACKHLEEIRTCYNSVVDPANSSLLKYIGVVFNMTKFESGYTTMCEKLKRYVDNYGIANLLKLEMKVLRKKMYSRVFTQAAKMSQRFNETVEYTISICNAAIVGSNKAESLLTGNDMAPLRQIMSETNFDVMSDICNKLIAKGAGHKWHPKVFPSLLEIPLAKPAQLCMNRSVPAFSYLYDDQVKCDKGNTTFWTHHMSCKRAEEMLDCINGFFTRMSFMPKTTTYLAQFLFDLDHQKKAFRSYCSNPPGIRNQLQCLPIDLLSAALGKCHSPWLTEVITLLGGDQKEGLKKKVCKKTKVRIKCQHEVLSKSVPKAAKLYTKLQMDGLPSFCEDDGGSVQTGVPVKETTTKATSTSSSLTNTPLVVWLLAMFYTFVPWIYAP